MATIKDVAKAAQVSVATVSRVLNDTGYVHIDTKTRVTQAMQELNYFPNEVARSLFKRESRLVGLILPDITNPFFPQLARGVEDEIHANGFRLLFGNSDEDREKEMAYLQTFKQNQVVGVIAVTNEPESDLYNDDELPVVFLDRTVPNAPSVFADATAGGKMAAMELIKRGSQQITLLKGPAHLQTARQRFKGALDVLTEEGANFHVMSNASFLFRKPEKAPRLFSSCTLKQMASLPAMTSSQQPSYTKRFVLEKPFQKTSKSLDLMIFRKANCSSLLYQRSGSLPMIWGKKPQS